MYFLTLIKIVYMATKYNPFGSSGWTYGEKMPGQNEHHSYLGPCPKCGTACFDYGGGWRCLAIYCSNNASNPAPNVGARPDWWNTNILIKKDGVSWCARYDDFVNLQESVAGFGDNPQQAVDSLKLAA